MTVFALISQNESAIAPLLTASFPGNHLKVGPGQWLIAVAGTPTAKEVWTTIVGSAESQPLGMVFPVTGYFGFTANSVWEWITAKRQTEP